MILRARLVVPVSRPPVPDGAVVIRRQRISEVVPWRDISARQSSKCLDLGDVALMPGLVNAHCHLDYTNMAGQFSPPSVFTDWLKLITSTKAGWGYSDFAESWLEGAKMLVRSGTTTVGDIEAVPELLPEVWTATPLRVLSFFEMLGITARRPPQLVLRDTLARISTLETGRCSTGISPHAPYSTVPELLRLAGETARQRLWRVATHVAESSHEFEMFAKGKGSMFDWLKRSGRDMSDCGHGSPIQHLERCGLLGENLLAIHVNYLGAKDAGLLGRHHVSVAHCPRSHAYFRHHRFPLAQLARARVNICLGTDSLASVYKPRRQTVELSMFEEMRALADAEPSLAPRKILQMATINGAKALGMPGQIGELAKDAWADLIAVPFTGKTAEVYDAVLQHHGDVRAGMIGGQWATPASLSATSFS